VKGKIHLFEWATSRAGIGAPDMIAVRADRIHLIEIKDAMGSGPTRMEDRFGCARFDSPNA
jgi:hypothetical protein